MYAFQNCPIYSSIVMMILITIRSNSNSNKCKILNLLFFFICKCQSIQSSDLLSYTLMNDAILIPITKSDQCSKMYSMLRFVRKCCPCFKIRFGTLPYTALEAQITPPPLIFHFSFFLILVPAGGSNPARPGILCEASLT